jgi:hypothetical protein
MGHFSGARAGKKHRISSFFEGANLLGDKFILTLL